MGPPGFSEARAESGSIFQPAEIFAIGKQRFGPALQIQDRGSGLLAEPPHQVVVGVEFDHVRHTRPTGPLKQGKTKGHQAPGIEAAQGEL